MNLILIIIPIVILIIGIGGYFTIFTDENIEISETEQKLQSENLQTLIQTNVKSLFKVMAYENDFEIIEGKKIWRNVFYELDESNNMIYDNLKNYKKSAVIFPIFTAAAYSEPGFYTFYRGECNDDCLTVKLDDDYNPLFTSSANGLQVLNLLDYDILTDISIHQNPEILTKYEKIILLHNEYVTSVEFDAILSHPNVIYLYPNALYAEVNFDEELWEISLVRGHNYPEITIRNGFDWKFDNSPEEYDVTCDDMKFSKIDNGWMLNCYPENVLHKNKELLKQIKDF
jgi:hypothetical protein